MHTQSYPVHRFGVAAGKSLQFRNGSRSQHLAVNGQEVKRAENLPQGINDSFLDPEMNVDDFIKRFEVESREYLPAVNRFWRQSSFNQEWLSPTLVPVLDFIFVRSPTVSERKELYTPLT